LCEVHLASMVDFLEYIAIGQGNWKSYIEVYEYN
jgi:hypothetical protein